MPEKPSPLLPIVSWTLGVVGALARFVYSFLPALNVGDVLIFGVIGLVLAFLYPRNTLLSLFTAAIPALVHVGVITARLGTDALNQGVGVGHALSFVTIPMGLALGALVGRWLLARRDAREGLTRRV